MQQLQQKKGNSSLSKGYSKTRASAVFFTERAKDRPIRWLCLHYCPTVLCTASTAHATRSWLNGVALPVQTQHIERR
jgi:hypothetical protein